jgi:hypothetical protein
MAWRRHAAAAAIVWSIGPDGLDEPVEMTSWTNPLLPAAEERPRSSFVQEVRVLLKQEQEQEEAEDDDDDYGDEDVEVVEDGED